MRDPSLSSSWVNCRSCVIVAARRPCRHRPARWSGCAVPRRARSSVTTRVTRAAASGEPEMVEQQRDREHRGGRVGHLLAGDVGGGAVHRLEHAREGAVRVDVAGCREADAAADRRGEIGEDVAEQVVGDDDVEPAGVRHHEDRRGVHVQVVDGDVRVFGRDPVDGALPERAGVDQHVGLVHEGELLRRPGCGESEREPHDPFDAVGRVDRHLGGDLVRRALAQAAAVADVHALGAFAHDDEVDRAGVRQRGGDTGEERGGPQVHVVVEAEAQLQQQAALDAHALRAVRRAGRRRRRRAGSRRAA